MKNLVALALGLLLFASAPFAQEPKQMTTVHPYVITGSTPAQAYWITDDLICLAGIVMNASANAAHVDITNTTGGATIFPIHGLTTDNGETLVFTTPGGPAYCRGLYATVYECDSVCFLLKAPWCADIVTVHYTGAADYIINDPDRNRIITWQTGEDKNISLTLAAYVMDTVYNATPAYTYFSFTSPPIDIAD